MLTPAFSASRTVREYTDERYIPAATAFATRASDTKRTAEFLAWQEEIARHWNDVHFGALNVTAQDGDVTFEVEVYLAGLDPSSVRVELYAEPQNGAPPFRQEMHRSSPAEVKSDPRLFSPRAPWCVDPDIYAFNQPLRQQHVVIAQKHYMGAHLCASREASPFADERLSLSVVRMRLACQYQLHGPLRVGKDTGQSIAIVQQKRPTLTARVA